MPAPSKIAKLPADLRAWLHQAFVDRAFGDIVEITDELNALCKQGGVAVTIGKSAVGAESQRVKRAQEAIRATTEAAKLLADASRDDADARSEAVMALVQGETFEVMLQVSEARDESDPGKRMKMLASIGKSVSMLSRARVNQAKHRADVELRVKAAADSVAKMAKKGGLTVDQVNEIRASILGISIAPAAPQA